MARSTYASVGTGDIRKAYAHQCTPADGMARLAQSATDQDGDAPRYVVGAVDPDEREQPGANQK